MMLAFHLAALETDEERNRFEHYYERYRHRLIYEAMKITHSQELAEDAVHNAFCSLIDKGRDILMKEPIDFLRWSVKVIRRKSIDIMRVQANYYDKTVSIDADNMPEIASDDAPVELMLTKKEDYERLKACISELDPLNHQILMMKYMEEKSFKEICAELGITLAQANSRMERTRAKIRKLLEKQGESDA